MGVLTKVLCSVTPTYFYVLQFYLYLCSKIVCACKHYLLVWGVVFLTICCAMVTVVVNLSVECSPYCYKIARVVKGGDFSFLLCIRFGGIELSVFICIFCKSMKYWYTCTTHC